MCLRFIGAMPGAAMARLAQIEPNIDLGTNSVRRIALTSSTVTGHIEKRR